MIASNSASSSANDVRIRQAVRGWRERISRHAVTPSPSWRRTSRTATSGSRAGTRPTASASVLASPTTTMSSSASSRSRSPRRTISWSSSRNTLIASGTLPSSRSECEDRDVASATERLLAPFARDVLLATGRAVRVRPARPDDVADLGRFYAELSRPSSYFRFFGARSAVPEAELRRATMQDIVDHVTLVVDANDELIAVGEYYAVAGAEAAEVAFAVADAHHSEGIATGLLEDLGRIAREAGFRRLVAQTLPDNVGMQRVFRDTGLVHRRWFEDGVVRVSLDLTAEDLLQDHADLRDWRAAVRSLQAIMRPGHVVVIGSVKAAGSPTQLIVDNVRTSFEGRVTVVDATAEAIDGVPDLAVIAVPAAMVADSVERCGAAGVAAAVV